MVGLLTRLLIALMAFFLIRRVVRGVLTRLHPQRRPSQPTETDSSGPTRPFDEKDIEEADYEDIS